jgi:hypothetical protein
MRFNRWEIAFDYPRVWYEWEEPQLEMAARDIRKSLAAEPGSIPRSLQDLMVLSSADQVGGVYIGVYTFESPVTPEDFLADRSAYFEREQAAGALTIEGITLTTASDYPAVEVLFRRASGGRSRMLYILPGERIIQLQFVVLDANRWGEFESSFKYILWTLQVEW